MPTLLVRGPDGTTREHAFEGELTIGRAEGNDLLLTEGGVSRKHAAIRAEGGALLIEDLGSANGTQVDGVRIEGPTPLKSASQVRLGDYTLSLKAAPARSSGARQAAAKPGSGPRPASGGPPRSTNSRRPRRSGSFAANRGAYSSGYPPPRYTPDTPGGSGSASGRNGTSSAPACSSSRRLSG